MSKYRTIIFAVAGIAALLGGQAQACGWNYPCNGHVYVTNSDSSGITAARPGFGDQGRAFAGIAGAATSYGLQAYDVPAPVANAAGNNVRRNFEIAGRESTPWGYAIASGSGISVDAIKKDGIAGGRCSVVRNPFGNGC